MPIFVPKQALNIYSIFKIMIIVLILSTISLIPKPLLTKKIYIFWVHSN